jgi:hypothetical protein
MQLVWSARSKMHAGKSLMGLERGCGTSLSNSLFTAVAFVRHGEQRTHKIRELVVLAEYFMSISLEI